MKYLTKTCTTFKFTKNTPLTLSKTCTPYPHISTCVWRPEGICVTCEKGLMILSRQIHVIVSKRLLPSHPHVPKRTHFSQRHSQQLAMLISRWYLLCLVQIICNKRLKLLTQSFKYYCSITSKVLNNLGTGFLASSFSHEVTLGDLQYCLIKENLDW